MPRILTALALLLALSAGAYALGPVDWRKNFAGLDGIAGRCVLSTDRPYALEICARIGANARTLAQAAGVALAWGGNTPIANKDRIAPSQSMKAPLFIDVYVRGSAGRTAGASVRIIAYVPYRNAIEKGAESGKPRGGNLVMWEEALVGSGPQKQLGRTMANVMEKKLKELIELFAAHAGNAPPRVDNGASAPETGKGK